VAARIEAGSPSGRMIVNARSYDDLTVATEGIRRARRRGRRFLFRTAASFVRSYSGITERPLLAGEEIVDPTGSGILVIVGSYVPKTTAQLDRLLTAEAVEGVEFSARAVTAGNGDAEADRVLPLVESALRAGRTAVVYTSRDVLLTSRMQSESNLEPSAAISTALVSLVRRLQTRPRFLIGKGGITSSAVATQGLGIRRATVLGQILPGVPVWRQGAEAKWPGGSLIVFPGNVGDNNALREVVAQLKQGDSA